jgi:hypothetical protein
MNPRRLNAVISFFVFLFGLCALRSQDTPSLQPLPHHSTDSFARAENRWQLTAVEPQKQTDTVRRDVRAQRDAEWRVLLEAKRGSVGSFGAGIPRPQPEFSVETGDIWAIATF